MKVALFQESAMFNLNLILVLGLTLQCVDSKGLSAGGGGSM